jgi:4-amino-4-deoxy-L-arabinose transferase-like glycosyltransferase
MNRTSSQSETAWFISKRWDLFIVFIITLAAALLRIPGIDHGIGFHPDERHMAMVTESLSANHMNPRSFAYGSFSFYAAWGFSQLVVFIRWVVLQLSGVRIWELAGTYDGVFFSGRIFCTIMGTLTVALSYYLATLVYKRSIVGIITAFLLATNVFHLQLSRFFTSDITLTTLGVISLIALVKAHQKGTLWSFLVFGACAGLATATKIASVFLGAPLMIVTGLALIKEWPRANSAQRFAKIVGIVVGGFVLLGLALFLTYWKGYPKIMGRRVAEQAFLIPLSIPFLAGISLALRAHSRALSRLFACFAVGVFVFVCAEPYAIIDFETFSRHTQEQTSMVRGIWRPPYTVQYEKTVPYFYHLKQMLWYTMGWPVFTLVVIGTVVASFRVLLDLLDKVFRRELVSKSLNPEMIPLTFVLVFFLATGYFQVKFPRYLIPLYPMLFAFAAALFASTFRTATPQISGVAADNGAEPEKLVSSKSLAAPVEVVTSHSPFFEEAPAQPQSETEPTPEQ